MQKLNEKQTANVSGGCFCSCSKGECGKTQNTDNNFFNPQTCQEFCAASGFDNSLCTEIPNAPSRRERQGSNQHVNNGLNKALTF